MRPSQNKYLSLLYAFGTSLGISACDDVVEPADITRADITKTYSAALLTTTTNGITTNHIAAGASLNITLRADGTTAGRVFVPDMGEDGGDFDASLDGQFTFDDVNDVIAFQHSADTFLQDMTLTARAFDGGIQLEGEETFPPTVVRLILR
jgi:hypothetical protein